MAALRIPYVNLPKAVEPVPITKKSVHRIRNPKNPEIGESFEIADPDYSFGPFYPESKSSTTAKDKAWKKIIEKEEIGEEKTTQNYLASIRKVEKEARAAYGDDAALVRLTESKFRWMMIKDGCFFLQLTLYILDDSGKVGLGYPDDDPIFGKNRSSKAIMGLIKSMFLVGNQIPLFVLSELMNREYFRRIIDGVKWWERPSDMLSKQILYDLLLEPKFRKAKSWKSDFLTSSLSSSNIFLNGLRFYYLLFVWRKIPTDRPPYYSSRQEKPSDLLHGLQLFLLGLRGNDDEGGDEDELEDRDLEAGIKLNPPNPTTSINISQEETGRETNFKNQFSQFITIKEELENNKRLSASNLDKKGICIMNYCKGGGSRGIFFQSRWPLGSLHIPPLKVNHDTNVLFTNLKYYEILHQEKEVRSYINFLANLVSSYEDVNILTTRKIIDENTSPENKQRFLDMLENLSDKEAALITHSHQYVIGRVKDYSVFPWEKFKYVAIIVFFLTIIQTVFGVLSWQVGKDQLHQANSTSSGG